MKFIDLFNRSVRNLNYHSNGLQQISYLNLIGVVNIIMVLRDRSFIQNLSFSLVFDNSVGVFSDAREP